VMSGIWAKAPLIGFVFAFVWSAAAALSFNVRTARIVGTIERVSSREGGTYEFWTSGRIYAFVLHPASLLDERDSKDMRMAKDALIAHRSRIWRYFFLGAAGFVGWPLLGILLMFVGTRT
jgi:hypothetical protein